jgi:molybdopterin-guanine dinucleotide biosynthesis protein A
MQVAVVVLAGGGARRWGGQNKTAALLGGRSVLEHAVAGARAGVAPAATVVVAGPQQAGPAGVEWVREDPPGGGPVAGLAAAVAVLAVPVEVVVVVAGDAPFGGTAVPRLINGLLGDPDADAAVGVDPDGRRQPLLAAYRLAALLRSLAAVGDPAGAPLRAVLAGLAVAEVPVTEREALDLDTPELLGRARALIDGGS